MMRMADSRLTQFDLKGYREPRIIVLLRGRECTGLERGYSADSGG